MGWTVYELKLPKTPGSWEELQIATITCLNVSFHVFIWYVITGMTFNSRNYKWEHFENFERVNEHVGNKVKDEAKTVKVNKW